MAAGSVGRFDGVEDGASIGGGGMSGGGCEECCYTLDCGDEGYTPPAHRMVFRPSRPCPARRLPCRG